MHAPVLLEETIHALDLHAGDFVIDGTVGGGGHASALLERTGIEGRFLGMDWDRDAISRVRERFVEGPHKLFVQGNYAELPAVLAAHRLPKADALLIDLGFSSDQIESSGRGFSFRRDEPLDMRYDAEAEVETAAELVARSSVSELARIFREYGEERRALPFAKGIVEARRKRPIRTSGALAELIERLAGGRRGKTHPATKVFMALRIAVNGEMTNVAKALANLSAVVKPHGRAAFITFHSLEDRLVKNAFRSLAKEGKAVLITKKPIGPPREEIIKNPRSRSAKLRAIEIL